MRIVRSFSSSARHARQALFELRPTLSLGDKTLRRRLLGAAYRVNPWLARDAKDIRNAFLCQFAALQKSRSQLSHYVATALTRLQDPESFQVKDVSFNTFMGGQTIGYPASLALIDLYHPLGVPPDIHQSAIPPIHDPSLVAQALSDAGLTGTFLQLDRTNTSGLLSFSNVNRPWPRYFHRVHREGFIYPPRLHIDADAPLDRVILTLPGATVKPLYDFISRFATRNVSFKPTLELVTLWFRSHDLDLGPEATALMVMASMQTEAGAFMEFAEQRGWANAIQLKDGRRYGIVSPVEIDFQDFPFVTNSPLDVTLLEFFRHWARKLSQASMDYAFTVRNGRKEQLIPRLHLGYMSSPFNNQDVPLMGNPGQQSSLWIRDRLVIQDPFLTSYNHTAHLSEANVLHLIQLFRMCWDMLQSGRPLVCLFGVHAAPPGSAAETKILQNPRQYSAAITMLSPGRVPSNISPSNEATDGDIARTAELHSPPPSNLPMYGNHARTAKLRLPPRPIAKDERDPRLEKVPWIKPPPSLPGGEPDPRLRRVPRALRPRSFHSSALSCANPSHNTPTPRKQPTPARLAIRKEEEKSQRDEEGYGLLDAHVRQPTFWRPGREPLKVPTRTTSPSSVPPARATRAGVAYKSVPWKPRAFHTSAACLIHDHRTGAPSMHHSESAPLIAARMRTLFAVQRAIQNHYGEQYVVAIFGSIRYGVSSPSSDIDMVILDPARKHGHAPGARRKSEIYRLKALAYVLRRAGFKINEVIESANVPIVKLQDTSTGQLCDINVNDRLGLINSELIKSYCKLNPVLRDMILYIKAWAKPLGLNRPSSSRRRGAPPITFSSYALVMMTIGFLQHRGLLPNLQDGLAPLDPGMLHGTFWLEHPRLIRCDVRFNPMEDWTPPQRVPAPELLRDWFKFWGDEFDMSKEMVSVRHGGRLLRSEVVPKPLYTGVMWNIDPFITTKNLTQNIGRQSLKLFQVHCRRTAMDLEPQPAALPDSPLFQDLEDDSATSAGLDDESSGVQDLGRDSRETEGEQEPIVQEETPIEGEWVPAQPLLWRLPPRRLPRRRLQDTPDRDTIARSPESVATSHKISDADDVSEDSFVKALEDVDLLTERTHDESSAGDNEVLDYHPRSQVDAYGRLVASEKPPPPPPVPVEEPEADEVGWGLVR